MNKLTKIFKKIVLSIGLFSTSVYTKVLAMEREMTIALYGIPQPDKLNDIPIFWKIARSLVIPIAFIIGVIIYVKKSSSSILRKIITILIALAIVVLACLGINYCIIKLI